jgi:hypothetical protein
MENQNKIATELLTAFVYGAFGEPKDAWNEVNDSNEFNSIEVEQVHFKLISLNMYSNIESAVDNAINKELKVLK